MTFERSAYLARNMPRVQRFARALGKHLEQLCYKRCPAGTEVDDVSWEIFMLSGTLRMWADQAWAYGPGNCAYLHG